MIATETFLTVISIDKWRVQAENDRYNVRYESFVILALSTKSRLP